MPQISEKQSLRAYNSFGIEAQARHFFRLQRKEDLAWLVEQPQFKQGPVLWLGGGSNMLLRGDYEGLVVKIELKGLALESLNESQQLLRAAAGENWHQTVLYSLEHQLGGLENLSLIPGLVGSAPIQNIGAYGVELKDHFHSLEAFDLKEKRWCHFDAAACEFAYRDSFFKGAGKGRYLITEVSFALDRAPYHQLHLDYGAIRQELETQKLRPSIHNLSRAVIAIRQSKLPDPAKIGNSGSFFKNPTVQRDFWQQLKAVYPDLVAYDLGQERYKLAAGWLIEQAGWKAYRRGDAGVHPKQALVLVNYGAASGMEIAQLASDIQSSVYRKFAVQLEAEVNLI